jgi:surfactin synthase thioesterase subunit
MLLEALAARGHTCLVVTRSGRGVQTEEDASTLRFVLGGVGVVAATGPQNFRAFFVAQAHEFRPDVIITSTDDPAQVLLGAALEIEHARTIFLARATIALPFGPDAAFASEEKTSVLRNVDGIVGVSEYVTSYIRKHSQTDAVHVPIALAEPGPYPRLGRFDNEFVTLANPCAVKGISILVGLARARPDIAFAGVPTWGTTAEDLALMQAEPNITILPKVDRIEDLLRRTRVLLMPSLWAEARSRMVVEAMLAGVPVMASNLGGLPEAKMHVPYLLPVRPVEGYSQKLNEQMVPVANVPVQDIGPWNDALGRLINDRAHWEELADLSHRTAVHYAETTTVEPFEQWLQSVKRKTRVAPNSERDALPRLSPQRLKLLELKLRKSDARGNALPYGAGDPARIRLFCFPHAGGGASFFRAWRQTSKAQVEIVPVQYPGHDTRRGEPLAQSMSELVAGLAESLRLALPGKVAFFGHSMGALVAFELARLLQGEKSAGPWPIIVSGARAPVFRLNYLPPPDPEPRELLDQVKLLGGLPTEAPIDQAAIDALLPVLDADTRLYRRYVYEPGTVLNTPIVAIGGESDPNVSQEHLERWGEVTTKNVEVRQFAGGHFFLRDDDQALLRFLIDSILEMNAQQL